MNVWALAWRWIRFRPLGAALNVALLGVGTATIALLLIVSQQFEHRLRADADAVDMVVGAKGSPMQLVLSTVFHVDAPVGNILPEAARFLAGHPMVERAIPLALGDGFRGYRIVGTDRGYPELYGAGLAVGAWWGEPLEAVLGAATAAGTGLEVGDRFVGEHGIGGAVHDEFPYRVVGVLGPTGTVVDRLVLTSVETVQVVHGMEAGHGHDEPAGAHDDHAGEAAGDHDHDEPAPAAAHDDHAGEAAGDHDHGDGDHGGLEEWDEDHSDHEHDEFWDSDEDDEHAPSGLGGGRQPEVTAFLVEFATPMAAVALPREINLSTAMQAARPAQEIRRLFRLVGLGADVVRAFAVILVAGAVLGLFTALVQALEERRTDLAMMRVLGATRLRLFWQILAESLILTATGAVLGLALAHGVAWGAGVWLWEHRQILVSSAWADGEAYLVLVVLALGLLAALPAAVRAARLDIPRVLSGG